jgi:hypothetical protein
MDQWLASKAAPPTTIAIKSQPLNQEDKKMPWALVTPKLPFELLLHFMALIKSLYFLQILECLKYT